MLLHFRREQPSVLTIAQAAGGIVNRSNTVTTVVPENDRISISTGRTPLTTGHSAGHLAVQEPHPACLTPIIFSVFSLSIQHALGPWHNPGHPG